MTFIKHFISPRVYATALLFLLVANFCSAIDPGLHQIKIDIWGAKTNQMQMGFGVDRKELADLTVAKITVELIVKNESSLPCVIAKSGSYQGVRFVQRSSDGQEAELPSGSSPRGVSNFIVQIPPNSEHHIFFKLPRERLKAFADASGIAQIVIHPEQSDSTAVSTPFSLEVAVTLPK